MKRKWLLYALILGLLFGSKTSFAQITIGPVNPGPYTPGSTIAAIFKLPANCFGQNNVFQLYLSDENGNFEAEKLIGSYTGFYSTYVNGIIPTTDILPGTGYKLRIKSTEPDIISTESAAFEIKLGVATEARLISTYLNPNDTETFGTCTSTINNPFIFSNESTAASVVTATVTNELTGTVTGLNFTSKLQQFTADQAHYTILTKAVNSDGTLATKAYFLINNKTVTAFGSSGNNLVCLPLGALEFSVDYTSPGGIQNNFPGDKYTITWGDNSTSVYTFCDIAALQGKVKHNYLRSSCGSTSVSSAGTIFNAFDVTIKVSNVFCGDLGTPVSSSAKVVAQPVNSFSFTNPGCTNTDITFINTSSSGENPNTNSSGCTENILTYNWYVDGVPVEANKPRSYNFITKFLTHGQHTIRLESNSSGACQAEPLEKIICIQDPPKPDFILPTNIICSGGSIKVTDKSLVDSICNPANTYSWIVSPAVTFINGTDSQSKEPEFLFDTAGIYNITLNITTPSCGLVSSTPQTVVVNKFPTVTLSPDIILCNLATYDFNPVTVGATKTLLEGTLLDEADTYTWTVTAAGTGTYSFVNGTSANTKYPSIKFDNYDEYTISVTQKNNCGTITKTQKLTFATAPSISAGIDQSICFNDPSFTLAANITGTTTSQTWIGGDGAFTPDRNTLNAVYMPTASERANGSVALRLRVTTPLAPPCDQIDDDILLVIKPNIDITSPASKSICTGKNVDYIPTSAAAGTVFNWTASGSSSVTGFSASGSGKIDDVLINTDLNTDATVTYVITPTLDGCVGTPFIFKVTVNPSPLITATAPSLNICNKTSAAISLSSLMSNVKYVYSSIISGEITGNTNQTIASSNTLINDILTNSGTTPATVTYTITPVSAGDCTGVPATITITVNPSATLANAGADEALCNLNSYTLKANAPVVGLGKWTIVAAPTIISFEDDTKYNTELSGLQAGNTYVLRWTISDNTCSTSSDEVQITVSPESVGGNTSGSNTFCAGTNGGNISLSNQVGSIIRWERSIDHGQNWSAINSTVNPLVYSNLEVTTQYRAIVKSGSCTEAISSVSIIKINALTITANAGINQSLCSGNGITLSGNNPAPNNGLWTLISNQTGVTIADPTLFNTNVTGLMPGEVYKFMWTITGFTGCAPSSSEVTITYFSPISNNINNTEAIICSGQQITISGDVPTGGSGSFDYQWQSSTDGSTWVNIPSSIDKNLIASPAASLFYRRLVNSTICTSVSNVLKINVLPDLANNTISADQQVCIGSAAAPLSGSIPTGGDGDFNYQWQSSLNGTDWSDVLEANTINFTPPSPTVTIYYRRVVTSGSCSINVSSAIKLTVNLPAKAEIIFNEDKGCAPFKLTNNNVSAGLYPDRNAIYTWFANGAQIGTGSTFPGYTILNQNETVTIKLAVTSNNGCNNDEITHIFTTREDVTASFTQNITSGCGPLNVSFTNTSTSLTAATFKWDFGNGNTSDLAQPAAVTFQPDPAGKDLTYIITLTSTTPCGITIKTSEVLVKAKPVATFSPDKTVGCSPFKVTFSNTTLGNSTSYTFDFGDGETLTTTDKANVSHTYNTLVIKDYIVKMIARNECGSTESQYTIRVSPNSIVPELVVNSNQLKGCAPFKVDFYNNTSGATSFVYDFADGSTAITYSAPEVVSHTFTKPGKYTITLHASNGCSNVSTTEEIEILEQPIVSFTADKTSGCDSVIVKFKNISQDGVGYVWDFGDGTTSTTVEPTHTFTGSGKTFTITLTATNILGCKNTVSIPGYIKVAAPLVAAFTVSPGNELSIPNFTFGFKDVSNDAVSWEWLFGDGSRSTLRNPNHTYANDGLYSVTLKVLNKEGCSATTTQSVRIIGVPGNLNLPNSFMPASAKNEIKTFKAKGQGIQEWKMSVFNKWGQLIWETTKLDDGAPAEGWDGTFKGQDQPQGVYYWKIDVKFINGGDWKGMTYDSAPPRKTGVIYLIR
ncbi:PKD domain-containing protein [Pedobacter sp. MC2016-05]|uniref:PKD domain-containing protein n=1 Tax=Pedobacter sp. MC2016-05 TaxID=2994474 RepID=UPI002245A1F8|nr:PKD domain-containing protein [Pedobacter sp. MC2016-05]MCX2473000.1 PKD domain-containing protein [Pedobacter sp. MC2016-05]